MSDSRRLSREQSKEVRGILPGREERIRTVKGEILDVHPADGREPDRRVGRMAGEPLSAVREKVGRQVLAVETWKECMSVPVR
jgi:hypothetical protein